MDAAGAESRWLLEGLARIVEQTRVADQALGAQSRTIILDDTMRTMRILLPLQQAAFAMVSDDGIEFDIETVTADEDKPLMEQCLADQIEAGTFSWALYQNRGVVVPYTRTGDSVYLHVLAVPNHVLGMFMGSLPAEAPEPRAVAHQMASLALFNCARTLEAIGLTRSLARHNENLEVILEERTRELRKSREEEMAANKAKGEFLAMMSHEMRTPLNAIIGMGDLLTEAKLSASQRDELDTMRASAELLTRLINDILDFSKIEAGHLEFEAIALDLRKILGEVLKLLAPKAYEKGLALLLEVEPTVPDVLVGDPSRLRQIAFNLVGNAIKFTERGFVRVSVELVASQSESLYVSLSVQDTGIGIPEDKLDSVFEAFKQADLSTTRRYGGTGLGLSITRKIVKAMRGELGVTSVVGAGTTFWARLPLQAAQGQENSRPHYPKGVRWVAAEPHEQSRELLKTWLRAWGAEGKVVARAIDLEPGDIDDHTVVMIGDDAADPTRLHELRKRPAQLWVRVESPIGGRRASGGGWDQVLSRPYLEHELLERLIAWTSAPIAIATTVERPKRGRRLNVLVVEDNAVNQKLVRAILEREGHQMTMVSDGQQGADAVESAMPPYDMVLMDVHMPVLDGLEATRVIRTRERALGGHIPIIGLTAMAMSGDRERCLAAGMDEYLTKPIRREHLCEKMDQVTGGGTQDVLPAVEVHAPAAPPAVASAGGRCFDQEELLARFEGDHELVRQVVEIFVGSCDDKLGQIARALETQNSHDLEHSAHALKGELGALCVKGAFDLAVRLERAGRNSTFTDAVSALDPLRAEVGRAVIELRELAATLT